MDETAIERAAQLLTAAWVDGKPLEDLPVECRPATMEEAYAVQAAFAQGLGEPVGYKIGYTNAQVQRRFGVAEPIFGQLFRERVLESPADVSAEKLMRPAAEPEIGFRMAASLPKAQAPFSAEQVAAAVDAAMPSIEVVVSRFAHWERVGVLLTVADNVLGSHWVGGAPQSEWTADELRTLEVVAFVDGVDYSRGRGEVVLGGPLEALVWLANALAERGRELGAGDLVTTGCITRVVRPQPGQTVSADFGRFGRVSVRC